MGISSNLTLFDLRKDMIIDGIGLLLDSKSILVFRSVSKLCQTYADTILRKIWRQLIQEAPEGVINMLPFMPVMMDADKNPLKFFKDLATKFIQSGVQINSVPLRRIDYVELQNEARDQKNAAFLAIWPKLRGLCSGPDLQDGESIRTWFSNPTDLSLTALNKITHLNLSKLGLKVLPVEVLRVLPKLQTLNLADNQLKTLPDELITFPEMRWMKVANNPLSQPCNFILYGRRFAERPER